MTALPIIVGYGGINAAGRSSDNQAFRRLIYEVLSPIEQARTINQIGAISGRGPNIANDENLILKTLENTLIRKIHTDWFDIDAVPLHRRGHTDKTTSVWLSPLQIPNPLPPGWRIGKTRGKLTEFLIQSGEMFLPDSRRSTVRSAGMTPTGFRPDLFYPSRNHPRTLQLALFAISDCWLSSGLEWQEVRKHIAPNQIAVFAGSSIGQMDESGFGGMLKNSLVGKRTTSKQLPLGYPQMPADFCNAYVLGSLGRSGASMGACASFLYNLHHAVDGIQENRFRVAIVGGADAPIVPEVIEGFRAMGALAEEKNLRELDALANGEQLDLRKTSRPFGENCGFTIGESSQFLILMDDALAIQLGATIFGSVPNVSSHSDGGKRSISTPGAGNYLTLAQSAASIRDLLGQNALSNHTVVQAHGTSTPQNRVTESDVLSRVATSLGLKNWAIAAVKSQLGHSQGTAGGDQLTMALGTFEHQIIPGIQTISALADDVSTGGLDFVFKTREQTIKAALINAKGFGGNNATAAVVSPSATAEILSARYGDINISGSDAVCKRRARYRDQVDQGKIEIVYNYGEQIVNTADLQIDSEFLTVPGFGKAVSLTSTRKKYSDLIQSKLQPED